MQASSIQYLTGTWQWLDSWNMQWIYWRWILKSILLKCVIPCLIIVTSYDIWRSVLLCHLTIQNATKFGRILTKLSLKHIETFCSVFLLRDTLYEHSRCCCRPLCFLLCTQILRFYSLIAYGLTMPYRQLMARPLYFVQNHKYQIVLFAYNVSYIDIHMTSNFNIWFWPVKRRQDLAAVICDFIK